jgi:hypothetical protein
MLGLGLDLDLGLGFGCCYISDILPSKYDNYE